MATYYCDISIYPTYASIPTWGSCQEGDGTALTAGTSAISSFVINSIATAGSSTISVFGVTLTAVASGASATQFNVGATTTLQADNIATAINVATGLINSSYANTTHQLRNVVYARGPALGAPANTVEIMTRVGTAKWNGLSVLSAANFTVSPTITQPTGGVGGCFGYLFNGNTTIWPSNVAPNSYGCMFNGSGLGPLSGNPINAGDTVIIRGNGQVILLRTSGGYGVLSTVEPDYIIDDGSYWTGDTQGTLTIRATVANTFTYQFGNALNKSCTFRALKPYGLIFEIDAASSAFIEVHGQSASSSTNGRVHYDNILLNDLSVAGGASLGASACPGNQRATWSNVRSYISQNKWPRLFRGGTITWTHDVFFKIQNVLS